MPQNDTCAFCGQELDGADICPNCGFAREGKGHIPGTLEYAANVDIYTVGGVTAVDGESTSYSAYDKKAGKRVILKEFLPVSLLSARSGCEVVPQEDKEVLFKNLMMDFYELYSRLQKLHHKALLPVYRVFEENGTAYRVLSPSPGDVFSRYMVRQARPFTYKEARWIFRDMLSLLSLLASKNIVHGGISDENIIITGDGYAVLTGFAIRDLRLRNDYIIYKLYDGFSAPEQYRQDEFPGLPADVYSMAALLYYSVTGKKYRPGALEAENAPRNIPRHVIKRLRRALEPEPSDRVEIDDFILLLDNKAEIKEAEPAPAPAKRKNAPKKGKSSANSGNSKKFIPAIRLALVTVIFIFAMVRLNSKSVSSSSLEFQVSSTESPVSEETNEIVIPNLVGKIYDEIMSDPEYTRNLNFNIAEEYSNLPAGEIIGQSPEAGTRVGSGATVFLTVSKGQQTFTVPDGLVGKGMDEVGGILDGLGIKYVFKEVVNDRYRPNTVTGTDRPAGTELTAEDTLIVYISKTA